MTRTIRRPAIFAKLAEKALSLSFNVRHWRAKTSRNDYKGTWNRLAFFEHDAKIGVAGITDEDVFRRSAVETVALLRTCVGLRPEDEILEIGAGVGRVGAALAPLCKTWIGTDVSKHMVAHMKRRLAGLANVEIVEISGYDLAAIPSASVDLVYCTVVFMHLEEWDRFNYIAEAFRVLKPGGRLLVDNVNLMSDQGWAFFEVHRAFEPHRRKPSISKTSTPQELRTYLTRAGFTEIQQKLRGMWVVAYGVKPGGGP